MREDEITIHPVKIGVGVVAVLLVLSFFLGAWYTVDEGDRGVELVNGAFVGTAGPGWHGKLPFVESIVKFSVRSEKTGYTGIEAYSKDVQAAKLEVSVNHRINAADVGKIYTTLGEDYSSRIIEPTILNETKQVFGQYNAVEIIGQRDALAKQITEAIATKLAPYGIIVDAVNITNIAFSADYTSAVEARMTAEVDVQKQKQTLEKEKILADIARTQAQGRADSQLMEAKASGDSKALQGLGEAKALDAVGDALRRNQDLVAFTVAKQWNGILPTTMLPGSSVPMLNLQAVGK